MSGLGGLIGKITDPGDFFGGQAAGDAAEAQQQAASQSIEEAKRQFDETAKRIDESQQFAREQQQPFQKAGTNALRSQQALIGELGIGAQRKAFETLESSPGQQFLQDRAQKNLLRSSAAIGGLGGGNVREALVQQGVGFAQQDLQNQFGRLGQLAGQGQTSAANIGQGAIGSAGQFGQLGAQSSGNIQDALLASGNARASGIQGQQQAKSNLLSTGIGIASIFSDDRLKENIRKTGKLENGLNWYTWDWSEEAKELVGNQRSEGVIAQEAKKLFPDAVTEIKGYLTVDYKRLH